MQKKRIKLWMTAGYRTALWDGCLVPDSPLHMATELFYPVSKGDYIECLQKDYVFAVATFSTDREEKYIYTYDYKADSAWLTYRQDLTPDSYSHDTYVFEEDGFCRICVKRTDGMEITVKDADKINRILAFYAKKRVYQPKECFVPEIEDTVEKVNALWKECSVSLNDVESSVTVDFEREKEALESDSVRGKNADVLSFALLTDSHYTVNGTWEDTADNIKKVLERLGEAKGKNMQVGAVVAEEDVTSESKSGNAEGNVTAQSKSGNADEDGTVQSRTDCADGYVTAYSKPGNVDGIVHLGDFTDGMTSKAVTSFYVKQMLTDLSSNDVPVYVTLGNHDSNYFRGNKQRLSMEEQKELFGLNGEFYYCDFSSQKVRCLFLSSYDVNEPVRYGFSSEEVQWVKETLDTTPIGYKVILFSHEAPLDILDYWARIVRNGKEMMQVLEEYNARKECQILAFIHGHAHAEQVYRGSSFPIISIGCNKCEYFTDKKPEHSYTCERKPGTVTQDLWDMLIVDAEDESLRFVRFGAGEDRVVDCHKTESTWRDFYAQKKKKRTTKIWAHRGSSGFAPENTLPAFEVAKELDVDGIELDVQMTKDGELVVIHDETIHRTSDGRGYVKDFTLEQLRKFNFAKNKPAFGFVTIPTLKEVYELFRDTDYVINVELKTGVIPYDGSDVTVGRWIAETGVRESAPDQRCIEERVHELTVEMGMEDRVIYSSFNHASVKKMQTYVTKERTAFLFCDGWLDVAAYGQKHGVQALHPAIYYPGMEKTVQECHEKGMQVNVWTVNEDEHALRLRDIGVDAIITNHPGKMRELYWKEKESCYAV